MLYKYWLYYFLFIKNIYSKRWRDINASVFSLALACLIIIILFIVVMVEVVFRLNGFIYLLAKGLPLGPIAIGVGFLVLLPTLILLNKLSIDNKVKTIRNALLKVQGINKTYTVFFLVLTTALFLITILLVITHSSGSPPANSGL